MHINTMRAGLERGEPQIGTWLTMVRNPAILSLMKSAGLDFARVDMEHTALTIEHIADLAVLARALDFPIAVRPPRANREWITRLLDIGVWNLHCPQVENAEHAREIVAASRYSPMGSRGNGGLSAATDFNHSIPLIERRAHANKQVFVTVMFETERAFADLDAIAAMPGIDALTIGPADLAQDMGVAGTPDQGRAIDEKRDMILAAARKHGKVSAMLVSSFEEMTRWKNAGATLLAYSSDADILFGGYRDAMKRIKGGS